MSVGMQGMAKIYLHLNANVSIACAADQGEGQQMPTLEGEGCIAFYVLRWLWP